jgi:hypothetical protein
VAERQMPRADLSRDAHESVRCPKGCGEFLAFRSDPMTGCTLERCWRCDAGWRRVVPAFPERPADGGRASRPLAKLHSTEAHQVKHRELLLERIPIAPRSISRPDLLSRIPGNAKAADRVLRELRRAGLVAGAMRNRLVFLSRRAS